MTTNFTEGSWNVKTSFRNNKSSHVIESLDGKSQATIITWGETVANAHLIAAAPNGFELGELVIKLCDHYEGLSPAEVGILYEAATEFIKKARGE